MRPRAFDLLLSDHEARVDEDLTFVWAAGPALEASAAEGRPALTFADMAEALSAADSDAAHPPSINASTVAPTGVALEAAYAGGGQTEAAPPLASAAVEVWSAEQILQLRPDVFRAFYTEYYGGGNDRNSTAWMDRVGGDTPEAYAMYWLKTHGQAEGFAQAQTQPQSAAAPELDVEQLFRDRPDVFQAYYKEYYGRFNDHRSSAWEDRIGGKSVEDYGRYWFKTHAGRENYSQSPDDGARSGPQRADMPGELYLPPPAMPTDNDPSLDPWNHPAIYPGAQKPAEAGGAPIPPVEPPRASILDANILGVGQALGDPDPFG